MRINRVGQQVKRIKDGMLYRIVVDTGDFLSIQMINNTCCGIDLSESEFVKNFNEDRVNDVWALNNNR